MRGDYCVLVECFGWYMFGEFAQLVLF